MGATAMCAEHEQQPPTVLVRPQADNRLVRRPCLASVSMPLSSAQPNAEFSSSASSPPQSPKRSADGKRKKHHSSSPGRRHNSKGSSTEASPRPLSDRKRRPQKVKGAESCTLAAFPSSAPTTSQAAPQEPEETRSIEVNVKQDRVASRVSSVGSLTSRFADDAESIPCPMSPAHRKPTRRPTPYYADEYVDSDPEVGVEAKLPSMALLNSPNLLVQSEAAAGSPVFAVGA